MKIGFVINYINENGPSHVVLNIINNLDRKKYDITLITLFSNNDPELVQKLRTNGIAVFECTSLNRWDCLCGCDKEFCDLITKDNYDIIHTHGLIPDLISSRLKCKVKRITTLHNNLFEDYIESYGYVKGAFYACIHLLALRKLDKCICCSKSVYDVMRRYIRNISYIRNGIEVDLEDIKSIPYNLLNIPSNSRVFLYAGILSARKQVAWLIKNFVQYHNDDEYLILLGDGPEKNNCEDYSDNHVHILGFRENVTAYMKMADIYISASRTEGFSISILEALSSGMGLLLSDIPSHREIVEMATDLYLGEIFSKDDFEKKIKIIREKKFDKNGIEAFQREMLSAKKMTSEYEYEYQQ